MYQLETAAAEVGLHINAKKTQCMNFNQPAGGIKEVEDYKYLGAWIIQLHMTHYSASKNPSLKDPISTTHQKS